MWSNSDPLEGSYIFLHLAQQQLFWVMQNICPGQDPVPSVVINGCLGRAQEPFPSSVQSQHVHAHPGVVALQGCTGLIAAA